MNSSTISDDPRLNLKKLLKMYDSAYWRLTQLSNYTKVDVSSITTNNKVLLKELAEVLILLCVIKESIYDCQ